jgi:hypothetical protein
MEEISHDLSYHSSIRLEVLRKNEKTYQDSQCPDRDSNQALLEYKSREFPVELTF